MAGGCKPFCRTGAVDRRSFSHRRLAVGIASGASFSDLEPTSSDCSPFSTKRGESATSACGTGGLSELLAPYAGSVVAVDDSPAMISAARKRLASFDNVAVRPGSLEALPIEDESLDVALLFLVLHYVVEPELAIAEAQRVLKPGGRLIVVDMMPHDRQDLLDEMGHVWRGFSEEQMSSLLHAAGFPAAVTIPFPRTHPRRGQRSSPPSLAAQAP
jgi:ArsR family transcriptional regulator